MKINPTAALKTLAVIVAIWSLMLASQLKASIFGGGSVAVYGLTLQSAEGKQKGFFVAEVAPGGKAEQAGIRAGDRIIGINNLAGFESPKEAAAYLAASDDEPRFNVVRGDLKGTIKLGEKPSLHKTVSISERDHRINHVTGKAFAMPDIRDQKIGISLDDWPTSMIEKGAPIGPVIIGVVPGSQAEEAGIVSLGVVESINGVRVKTKKEAKAEIGKGGAIRIVYWHGGVQREKILDAGTPEDAPSDANS